MRIHHVQLMIEAGREAEARAFYGSLLGLEAVARPAALPRPGLWFRCGDQEIHLGIQDEPPGGGRGHPGFLVAGYDRLRDRLAGADFEVRDGEPLNGRRRFHTRDPFGNRLEFIEDPNS